MTMRRFIIPLALAAILYCLYISADFFAAGSCAQLDLREPVKIMPLGDSITQGMANQNSYRRALFHRLNNTGFTVDFVGSENTIWENLPHPNEDFDLDHEGHWGWRADNILHGNPAAPNEGKLADWLGQSRPDFILLHIGSNDINQGQDVGETTEEIAQIIAIARLANPNIAVFLAQLIPWNETRVNSGIGELNKQIEQLAKRMSMANSPVILVDQHSGFNPVADSMDNVHPNASGEEKMAKAWSQEIQRCLKDSGLSPVPGGA